MIKIRVLFLTILLILSSCKRHFSNENNRRAENDVSHNKPELSLSKNVESNVLVSAHRGDWRNAPENSLLAMEFCINNGIDIMETDLKMTKDSILILMHDETLNRTTTGFGYVKDWILDSIQKLKLKNGYGYPTPYQVPTLEEALMFAKDRIIIDLDKSYPYIREAYKIANKTKTLNQVIFRVNDSWKIFNSKYNDIIDEINYMPLVWWNTKDPSRFIKEYLNAPNPPLAIEIIYNKKDSQQFLAFREFGKLKVRVMMNTIYPHLCANHDDYKALKNPDANWGWVIENDATIIGTDRPKLLLDYLKFKGLHN